MTQSRAVQLNDLNLESDRLTINQARPVAKNRMHARSPLRIASRAWRAAGKTLGFAVLSQQFMHVIPSRLRVTANEGLIDQRL